MNNFSKLSTATLFKNNNYNNTTPACSKRETQKNFVQNMSIDTLFRKNDSYNFDSKILLNTVHERKKKLDECYTAIYKKCCNQITDADKLLLTHIEYDVPVWSDYINYSCKDCIEFIKNKLEEQKLNVFVISKTKLYISWHDLEQKIENKTNTNVTQELSTKNLFPS